jgi:hypothetical protein
MNPRIIPIGAAVLLVLLVTGCATDDTTARTQEKSAVYATLGHREKRFIAKGRIAVGFTADMVYMAMGHPSKVKPVTISGETAELWIYDNYYPPVNAFHMRYSDFGPELPYQPVPSVNGLPAGSGQSPASIATTGPPQGGSMEPADLRSFTIWVLFQNGQVVRLMGAPN